MANNKTALVGNYEGIVVDFEIGLSANKDIPMLNLYLKADKDCNGPQPVDMKPARAEFTFFLSDDMAETGKYAGKTKYEICRTQLKAVFGYEGGLTPDELNALVGKRLRMVCEENDKGYTKVKFINPVSFAAKKRLKELDPATLAKMNAAFKGTNEPAPTKDPKALFKAMLKKA